MFWSSLKMESWNNFPVESPPFTNKYDIRVSCSTWKREYFAKIYACSWSKPYWPCLHKAACCLHPTKALTANWLKLLNEMAPHCWDSLTQRFSHSWRRRRCERAVRCVHAFGISKSKKTSGTRVKTCQATRESACENTANVTCLSQDF